MEVSALQPKNCVTINKAKAAKSALLKVVILSLLSSRGIQSCGHNTGRADFAGFYLPNPSNMRWTRLDILKSQLKSYQILCTAASLYAITLGDNVLANSSTKEMISLSGGFMH